MEPAALDIVGFVKLDYFDILASFDQLRDALAAVVAGAGLRGASIRHGMLKRNLSIDCCTGLNLSLQVAAPWVVGVNLEIEKEKNLILIKEPSFLAVGCRGHKFITLTCQCCGMQCWHVMC